MQHFDSETSSISHGGRRNEDESLEATKKKRRRKKEQVERFIFHVPFSTGPIINRLVKRRIKFRQGSIARANATSRCSPR